MPQPNAASPKSDTWWRDAVFYQIYPRSYADSDGDGIGDLRGIVSKFDHLTWLGVDALWLNPTMPSPDRDWGYDVSDYLGVHPELGTMDDLDELIAAAGRRGIGLLLDLVPNHTSDAHAWFVEAVTGVDAEHRDWYVWADPAPDGGPPNNWISVFRGEPAWTLHEPTGQYYLHNFLSHQPDLNWWNPGVRDAFDEILRFWFDRGVAGFRIDVAHALIKDRELRDNPPSDDLDHAEVRKLGQKQLYNMNRPEGHEVIRRWRAVCGSYEPPRILVGETYVLDVDQLASFYGNGGDELNLAFNFPFAFSSFEPDVLASVVGATNAAIPTDAWPVWMASNHDVGRFPTRWCDGDESKARLALMLLLTMRGSVFLYYGDEIGMTSVVVERARLRDPVGIRHWPEDEGRDHCRTPMPWSAEEGGGFTAPGVEPWLPLGDLARNVAAQMRDDSSVLHLTRELIRLRRDTPDLLRGDYSRVESPAGTWCYRRGREVVVFLNMSGEAVTVDLRGRVALSTDRSRDGETLRGPASIAPWVGVVVRRSG